MSTLLLLQDDAMAAAIRLTPSIALGDSRAELELWQLTSGPSARKRPFVAWRDGHTDGHTNGAALLVDSNGNAGHSDGGLCILIS